MSEEENEINGGILRDMERPSVLLVDATEDELWEEICSRYRSVLLCYLIEGEDRNDERTNYCYSGGRYTCIGLAQRFIHNATHDEPIL